MNKLINLMPHMFTLLTPIGVEKVKGVLTCAAPTVTRTIPSSGVARATQAPSVVGEPVDGVPTTLPGSFGPVEGLPDPDGETSYIVSFITVGAARASGRAVSDLLTPGDLVRDAVTGQPVGCLNLARHS